jgi:hypothetical protein
MTYKYSDIWKKKKEGTEKVTEMGRGGKERSWYNGILLSY